MSEHSNEPWRIGLHGYQKGKILSGTSCDLKVVAETNYNFPDIAAADSKRIVACVNACTGFSTEFLEQAAQKNEQPLKWLMLDDARQRDELLAALKLAKEWLEGWASAVNELAIINAAIAKVEGKGDDRDNT